MADINQQAQEYYYLVQKGMAPAEAFKKVFPNGIPTAQERAKSAAGDQQKQAYGQLAGALAGLYGAKKLSEMELPSFGSLFGGGEAGVTSLPDVVATGGGSSATGLGGGSVTLTNAVPSAAEPGLLSGVTAAPAYIPAAVLGATALGGKAAYDMLKGNKPGLPGRAILGMATGGLSELANGLLGQKSTRERARENTANLQKSWGDDVQSQNYLAAMRDQYNSAPPDPSKPFAGKYSSWDEYVKGGLEADNLTGVLGNLETYGSGYGKMNFDEQKALTQANIDAGNYYSDKGEVKIRDAAKALSFLNPSQSGLKNLPLTKGPALIAPAGSVNPQANPLVQALARSKTSSPGIDKNGKRISY